MTITVLPRQWLITADDVAAGGAELIEQAGLRVLLGPGMAAVRLEDRDGRPLGCLLGEPIDVEARRFLASPHRLPWPREAIEPACLERWLGHLGGAFVALVTTDRFARLYPSATRTCVYELDARRIATTPGSLLAEADYRRRLDTGLFEQMEIERLGWLPAGLTCHRGIARLLPDHYLDLATWQTVRFWRGPSAMAAEPEAAVERIARLMEASMAAVAERYLVRLAFTAGRDSRAVLAACRGLGERLTAFTIGHDTAGPDREIPEEICRHMGIPHRLFGQQLASEAERERWLAHAGHCVGGSNLRLHRTVGVLGAGEAVVTGAAGEVGRGFYWNAGDGPTTPLNAQRMLARMDLKPLPPVVEAMERWLAGLEGLDTLRILDLAYVELRMGCWGSPQSHGFPEAPYHFTPLDHREIFAGLLSLPPDWRRGSRYVDALIAALWPELAAWPFNRFDGLRQLAYLSGKLLSYERIRRKVRRHLGARLSA